ENEAFNAGKASDEERAQHRFLLSISTQLRGIKDTVRNPAMHVYGTFVAEDTMDTWNLSKSLVRRLIDNGIRDEPTSLPTPVLKLMTQRLLEARTMNKDVDPLDTLFGDSPVPKV